MEINGLALQAAKSLMGNGHDDEILQQQLIKSWGLIHGLITLKNSHAVDYVTPSPALVYKKIIDEFISSLNSEFPQLLNEALPPKP